MRSVGAARCARRSIGLCRFEDARVAPAASRRADVFVTRRVVPLERRARQPSVHLARDVHPALVQAELLARAEAREHASDALGKLSVGRQVLAAHERGVRAQPLRLGDRREFADASLPSGVVRGDHQVLLGHRDRSRREIRVAELLYLCVEAVRVEVCHDPAVRVGIRGRRIAPTGVVDLTLRRRQHAVKRCGPPCCNARNSPSVRMTRTVSSLRCSDADPRGRPPPPRLAARATCDVVVSRLVGPAENSPTPHSSLARRDWPRARESRRA